MLMHTRCYFVMVNCNLMICELHYDRLYTTQPKALPALRYIYMILMGKRVCLCIVQWQSIVIIACRLSSGLVWSGLVWPGLFCICAIDRSIDQSTDHHFMAMHKSLWHPQLMKLSQISQEQHSIHA